MTTGNAKLVLIRNAVANLVRGGTSAFVALLLPFFLTRLMPEAEFGAWSLILQLGAYVSFLDFGIQTAVSRFVAHATERNDLKQRDEVVSTAFFLLAAAGLAAWVLTAGISSFLPHFFHQIPAQLMGQSRIALLFVAGSLAVGLPASTFIGIFVGLQRNAVPASIVGVSKILSAILVVILAWQHRSIAEMGAVTGGINLLSYVAQYLCCMRAVPDIRLSIHRVTKAAFKSLVDYCLSLTVWAIGLLLVTGLDLSIVAHYHFNEVAYYSIAATIVTFLSGFYNALVSPMMPATAILHARGEQKELSRIVNVTTRYGMALLLSTGAPLILAMAWILKIWVGTDYAIHTAATAQILIIANIIRLCLTPYVVAMIGSGDQRLVMLTPILEGVSNLIFSLIGGYYFGSVGVALGTLMGAIVGLIGMLTYNMPRTSIKLNAREYSYNSLARPSIAFLPTALFLAAHKVMPSLQPEIDISIRLILTALTFLLLRSFAFEKQERSRIKTRLLQKLRLTRN